MIVDDKYNLSRVSFDTKPQSFSFNRLVLIELILKETRMRSSLCFAELQVLFSIRCPGISFGHIMLIDIVKYQRYQRFFFALVNSHMCETKTKDDVLIFREK